jgi:hypothetical protein
LGWGIVLLGVGVLHLAFRGFYARRAAAIETAKRETAPGPFKGRVPYVTGQRANMIWIVGSSVAFIVIGAILILTRI